MATDPSRLSRTVDRLRTTSKRRLARTTAFYLSVLAFVFFWLLAFSFHLGAVFTTWFDPVLSDTVHFVHNIALATWVWIWGAAMVVQLYRPARRVTAMQVALLLTLADLGVGVVLNGFDPLPILTSDAMLFFAPVFVAGALHPARAELFSPGALTRENLDIPLAALAALAVVPVSLYVLGELEFQTVLTDEHAALGHYGTMSYYGLSLLALGVLASLRNRGRRFAAYGAGLLAVMLAVASVFQPTMSGLNTTWAVLSTLWGLAFVGTYEWTVRTDMPVGEPTRSEDTATAP